MKKLLVIALALCTFSGFAQEKEEQADRTSMLKKRMTRSNYSPEDRAQIQTKQMTLQLDLTEQQQQQVNEVLVSHFTENEGKFRADKKKNKEMTDEERKNMKLAILDSHIALKEKMKSILNDEQYEKYSKTIDLYTKKRKGRKAKMKGN